MQAGAKRGDVAHCAAGASLIRNMRGRLFLMSEVPLCRRATSVAMSRTVQRGHRS